MIILRPLTVTTRLDTRKIILYSIEDRVILIGAEARGLFFTYYKRRLVYRDDLSQRAAFPRSINGVDRLPSFAS